MPTARLFTNGNSQVVRMPKGFRFKGDEVIINKVGGAVILLPKHYAYSNLKVLLEKLARWTWNASYRRPIRRGILVEPAGCCSTPISASTC